MIFICFIFFSTSDVYATYNNYPLVSNEIIVPIDADISDYIHNIEFINNEDVKSYIPFYYLPGYNLDTSYPHTEYVVYQVDGIHGRDQLNIKFVIKETNMPKINYDYLLIDIDNPIIPSDLCTDDYNIVSCDIALLDTSVISNKDYTVTAIDESGNKFSKGVQIEIKDMQAPILLNDKIVLYSEDDLRNFTRYFNYTDNYDKERDIRLLTSFDYNNIKDYGVYEFVITLVDKSNNTQNYNVILEYQSLFSSFLETQYYDVNEYENILNIIKLKDGVIIEYIDKNVLSIGMNNIKVKLCKEGICQIEEVSINLINDIETEEEITYPTKDFSDIEDYLDELRQFNENIEIVNVGVFSETNDYKVYFIDIFDGNETIRTYSKIKFDSGNNHFIYVVLSGLIVTLSLSFYIVYQKKLKK